MELNGTIFLQVFIFLTVLLWLSRSLFAPMLRLFDERERRIDGARKEAYALDELAQNKSKLFDEEYEKAKDKARQVLSQLKHAMEKEHSEHLDKVKALAKEKIENASALLKNQEDAIRMQLQQASISIADDMVHAITNEHV